MDEIRLLVVDDHTLFRRGLIALLSQEDRFKVSGEAGDIGEALRRLAQDKPDVILLDNHLPGVRGVDGIAALKDAAPKVRILMLTVSENEEDLAAALHAGADGYLLKTVESDQLNASIFKVLAGESVISPEMMSKLVTAFRAKGSSLPVTPALASLKPQRRDTEPLPIATRDGVRTESGRGESLSIRERQIVSLIARGDSNKMIARELNIAETTVKIHVQHILRKLQLTSRVQVAVYATGQGAV